MKTNRQIVVAIVLSVLAVPALAANTKCNADVSFSRISADDGKVSYTADIRHYAPTELANVSWSYRIHYVDWEGRSRTARSAGSHSTARSHDSHRSYFTPDPKLSQITDYEIYDITCWYNG